MATPTYPCPYCGAIPCESPSACRTQAKMEADDNLWDDRDFQADDLDDDLNDEVEEEDDKEV